MTTRATPRMASGYRQVPVDAVLDDDGRCRLSGLLPAHCGLTCHRGDEIVPVIHEAFPEWEAAA